jgi:glycosyltransferase involved in cell wall biosynthesis
MKVIRVLGKLEPGGAQLALLRLTQELRRRHGVDTTLLVGDATPAGVALARSYDVEPICFRVRSSIHPLRNRQWQRSWPFARWLADRFTESDPAADIVHAHMVGAWWATAQVIGPATAFVATEHNEVNWSQRRTRSLQAAAARIDRFYAMGPAANRFAVAAGVPIDVIRPARSPVAGLDGRPRAGLATPRLTFAGRLSPDKGPDVLIEAIRLLQRPDLTCYLLGDGPMRAVLEATIRQAGLTDQILLPGWVDDPWTYVAGSSVHVVPSREEAWSQSAVLALGLGVPVIGTDVDGLADTLSQSRGVIIAAEDPPALSASITDVLAGRLRTDQAAATEYARQFTSTRVSDFYRTEYESVLTDRGNFAPVR